MRSKIKLEGRKTITFLRDFLGARGIFLRHVWGVVKEEPAT